MKYCNFIVLLLAIGFASCDLISIKDNGNDSERDVVGDVLALVSPDSVQMGVPFTVQISYLKVCGGTFKSILTNPDTNGHIFVQPIIYVVPQSVCPAVLDDETVSTSITIAHTGHYTLTGIGNYGIVSKDIVVASSLPSTTSYRFYYRFQNRTGNAVTLHSSNLQITSATPIESFSIQTDANGIWDTTFTNTSTTLTYMIGSFQFHAKQGIKENGIIIIP